MNVSFENRFHLTVDLLRIKYIIPRNMTPRNAKRKKLDSLRFMWSNHRKEKELNLLLNNEGWEMGGIILIHIFNNK